MENKKINKNEPIQIFYQSQKKSNKKIILIILSILLFIILLGIGVVYFLYQKGLEYQNEQIENYENERESLKQNLFSLSEYNVIPDNYKEHIYHFMEYNGFLDGTYFLTKISDRAKNVFAFGDFTNDNNDENDMAIIIEKDDFSSSKLVIFNHKGELLYVEDFSYELPIINSYKVGAKIYMDELKLVPSPSAGLIVKTASNKRAVVYDKKEKKFKTYYQYTQEDIDAMNREADYDYDDYIDIADESQKVNTKEDFEIKSVE